MSFVQKIEVLQSPKNQYLSYTVKATDFPDAENIGQFLGLACSHFKLDRGRCYFRARFWKKMNLADAVPEGEHEIAQVPLNRIEVVKLIEELQICEMSDDAMKIVVAIKKIVDPKWLNIHWLKDDIFTLFINSCDMFACHIDSGEIEEADVANIAYYLHMLKGTTQID